MNQHEESPTANRIMVKVNLAMKGIVPQFLLNAKEDVKTLREAIEQTDYESIARLGHSLKGASGIGFEYMKEIGLSLESRAHAQELCKIRELVDELEDYVTRVEPVYETC